ncbi:MAG: pyridoxal-phosphate dependent enzyme [Promethearchaeota archaeon]|nr:MAG: pyridoxal-phosphate dependent enzyme [Candidatus Lokiarchaeota archaeon]
MLLDKIEEAYNNIKDAVNKTPVMTSRTLNKITSSEVFLKCENFQRMGAFKFRGAYNTLSKLSKKEREKGVITHSSGNHAQAVALASKILGIQATIVMPKGAPKVKINATRDYGAKIVFCENNLQSRTDTTEKLISEYGFKLIHPYDNENIIYGQGTAAFELIKQVENLDMVIAPLGGGGLLSGTAIATKGLMPHSKVYGVEPALADDALRSVKAGYIIASNYPNTIADGLRTSICDRTFSFIKEYVDDILTVSEEEIIEAMRFIWERMKIIVEPSGVVPVAAILSQKIKTQGHRIGLILSVGNIELNEFFSYLENQILNGS